MANKNISDYVSINEKLNDKWNPLNDYNIDQLIVANDGHLYRCIKENGPGTINGIKNPINVSISPKVPIGTHWEMVTVPVSGNWRAIAYSEELNIIVAASYSSANMIYSKNKGLSWTKITLPVSSTWYEIVWGYDKFVCMAYNTNVCMYSYDGINWIQITLPASAGYSGIAYGNGKFIISGNARMWMISSNGINWSQITVPTSFSTTTPKIRFLKDRFICLSTTNQIFSSTDGITWTVYTLPVASNWCNAMYSKGKFVITSYSANNKLAVSEDDCQTWEIKTLPVTGDWYGAFANEDVFMVLPFSSSALNYVYTSPDLTNWTKTILPASGQFFNNAIIDNKKLIAPSYTASANFFVSKELPPNYLENIYWEPLLSKDMIIENSLFKIVASKEEMDNLDVTNFKIGTRVFIIDDNIDFFLKSKSPKYWEVFRGNISSTDNYGTVKFATDIEINNLILPSYSYTFDLSISQHITIEDIINPSLDFKVDWGDEVRTSKFEDIQFNKLDHTYSSDSGIITIKITGYAKTLKFNDNVV